METMRDKVVMITGAAASIGLACAEAFAKEGATTILVDINKPEAQARKLMNEGYQMIAYGCDVSNTQAVKEMVDWIVATYGRLDAAHDQKTDPIGPDAASIRPTESITSFNKRNDYE